MRSFIFGWKTGFPEALRFRDKLLNRQVISSFLETKKAPQL